LFDVRLFAEAARCYICSMYACLLPVLGLKAYIWTHLLWFDVRTPVYIFFMNYFEQSIADNKEVFGSSKKVLGHTETHMCEFLARFCAFKLIII
jgi:hypothetical protein